MKASAAALAVVSVFYTADAVATEKPLLGFAHTPKMLNELLAEGYELKSGSAAMGVLFMLQKGGSVAVCGATPDRHDCQITLDLASAKTAAQAVMADKAATQPPPKAAPRSW